MSGRRAPRQVARKLRRLARSRRHSRRPRGRDPAQHAREHRGGAGAPPSIGRRLVVLLARLRRAGRARSLRADRAQGADCLRRLLLRRQDHRHLRQARRRSSPSCRRCEASSSCPYIGQRRGCRSGAQHEPHPQGRPAQTWADAVLSRAAEPPHFERLPFAHPLYVLFSSGTTGMPEVHRALGRRHAAEASSPSMCCIRDIKPGDRVFYFTTLGWMMWNWLVSALGSGATLLLYDGSPFHPDGNILWDYAAGGGLHPLRHVGEIHRRFEEGRPRPRTSHDLSALRAMHVDRLAAGARKASTTSTSTSSQTCTSPPSRAARTSCGCFVLGIPTKPVWRGEIQGPALGLAVDVFDENGQSLPQRQGRTRLHEPVPVHANRLLERSRRPEVPRSAYFSRFPNVWHHGDFAEWTRAWRHDHPRPLRRHAEPRRRAHRHGGDLSPGRACCPRCRKSIVVGQDWEGDVRVVLFVVLKPGLTLDERPHRSDQERRSGPEPALATCPRKSSRWRISRAPSPARSPSLPCATSSTAVR